MTYQEVALVAGEQHTGPPLTIQAVYAHTAQRSPLQTPAVHEGAGDGELGELSLGENPIILDGQVDTAQPRRHSAI